MSNKLYVGNIAFSSTEADLRDLFGRHGTVESVAVITDRETGRSRGFAFVEMEEAQAARDAIRALDGTELGAGPSRSTRPRTAAAAASSGLARNSEHRGEGASLRPDLPHLRAAGAQKIVRPTLSGS